MAWIFHGLSSQFINFIMDWCFQGPLSIHGLVYTWTVFSIYGVAHGLVSPWPKFSMSWIHLGLHFPLWEWNFVCGLRQEFVRPVTEDLWLSDISVGIQLPLWVICSRKVQDITIFLASPYLCNIPGLDVPLPWGIEQNVAHLVICCTNSSSAAPQLEPRWLASLFYLHPTHFLSQSPVAFNI